MTTPPAGSALPIVCTSRRPTATPPHPLGTLLITGAAGTVGTIAAAALQGRFRLVSLDLKPPAEPELFDVIIGSVADRDLVFSATARADHVLHLAGGAPKGWDGLLDAELGGTRNVIDGALESGCVRVVLASSNHVSGWHELDQLAGAALSQAAPSDPLRPDGLYAASKAFVEALGRSAAECSGLPVSVLRIGTMRVVDDPRALAGSRAFRYIGSPEQVVARMERTWLYHEDFRRILLEEFAAKETFRLRYAVSGTNSPWSTEILSWTRQLLRQR
ncbi:nucleoside-diphosphate-sugar epimerase [Arthrobacter sp. V4I6]|uniref:NAD-dependent epimerase/dehydratase family protein n=1 Tax=unclassified Arthrobacter TaxID=235627 RepID=UPI0027814546|nr:MULTISPECIES: NAD(P)-dependent oxidoreductase [unclassified Arthrobacter]MDQ0820751.1 nucleoside-diphosphate-sugar epimerase [Arthrobacter sp. V1I7]MDQ0855013.1 nucleoside-diphosphate-sugar epimerase [Arthrobacter sp. V4I6]